MAVYGNTVLLKAEFTDIAGTPVDPTEITLTIYDKYKREIKEISIGVDEKVSTGVYAYSYNLYCGEGVMYYEYRGIIDGIIVLNRAKIDKDFYTVS